MDKLYILDVAEKNKTKKEFFDNIISKGSVTKNNQLNVLEDEGISLIEKTIPYIENIYRNANRLIVNEEEIVREYFGFSHKRPDHHRHFSIINRADNTDCVILNGDSFLPHQLRY